MWRFSIYEAGSCICFQMLFWNRILNITINTEVWGVGASEHPYGSLSPNRQRKYSKLLSSWQQHKHITVISTDNKGPTPSVYGYMTQLWLQRIVAWPVFVFVENPVSGDLPPSSQDIPEVFCHFRDSISPFQGRQQDKKSSSRNSKTV